MYALWKVGAIVVLCNPMFKQKELEYHLNDSGAKDLIFGHDAKQIKEIRLAPQAFYD